MRKASNAMDFNDEAARFRIAVAAIHRAHAVHLLSDVAGEIGPRRNGHRFDLMRRI
jgi:hypothetical protein